MAGSPALVLGPIVRYTDQNSFAVWLQLDAPATLVGQAVPLGGRSRARIDSRVAFTARVHGRHYAIVYFEKLAPATFYKYAVVAAPGGSVGRKTPHAVRRARGAVELPLSNLTYGEPPAVRTFPRWSNREPLRAAFGSCRCFEGGFKENKGPDVLELFGADLEARSTDGRRATDWPHLLFLMGDQIYADDVGPTARKRMLARSPIARSLPTLYTADREMAAREVAKGDVPAHAGAGDFHCVDYADYADLYEVGWLVPDVRSLFARLPTFMLPDDHDVTDDFMISGSWIRQVLDDPPWRKTVVAAMTAYWVYQGWGNLSRKAAGEHPATSYLAAAGGKDVTADLVSTVIQSLGRDRHAPVYFTVPTEPPIIAIDARTDRQFVAPAPDPLITGSSSIKVGFHRDDRILSETQSAWLERQLKAHERPLLVSSVPIFTTPFGDYMLGRYTRQEEPMLPVKISDQRMAMASEVQLRANDADTWFAFPRSVNALLRLLSTRGMSYVVSGDVHFSFVLDNPTVSFVEGATLDIASMQKHIKKVASRLIHIVSSALQNQWSDEQARELETIMERSREGYLLRYHHDGHVGGIWKKDRVDRPSGSGQPSTDAQKARYGTHNNVCEVVFHPAPSAPLVTWSGASTATGRPLEQLARYPNST